MAVNTQVKLRLTENPEVLQALSRNGALRQNEKGEPYLALQFDSQHFHFVKGQEIIVPEPVALGLYRGSGVLIGDAMSGTQQPGVEVVEKWELGEQEPSRKAKKTVCSVCGEDQGSIKKLVAHMAEEHSEEEEEEEK